MATSQISYLVIGSIRTLHTSKAAAVGAFANLAKRRPDLTGVVVARDTNKQFHLSIGARGAVRVKKA